MSTQGYFRRAVAAASALVLLVGLAGLTGPIASAVAPAAPSFKPTLDYYKCPPKAKPAGVRCAKLSVPLDWQSPDDGRTTTIDVRVMRSKEGGGGLTFNPGGPGGSGVEAFEAIYSLLPDDVKTNFDFIGWDPRGVGESGPKLRNCTLSLLDPPATGPVDWQAYWQDYADMIEADNTACMAANPDSAPYLGTWQVVRDLDALRSALGYEKWNYWGMSYGTRIGRVFAQTFPNRLRALIMDGSVMANESIYRFGTSFPSYAWISMQLYPSLASPTSARKIKVIEDHLEASVLALPDGVDYTRWDWVEQYRVLLASESQYGTLQALINYLYVGITGKKASERREALEVVSQINEFLKELTDDVEGGPVLALVNCSDMHDRPTVAELADASEMVERNYGVKLSPFIGNSAVCFGLDPDKLSPPVPMASTMIRLKTPPVFVLSSGDAATPWVWGSSLANAFQGSRTVTYEGTQHVAYLSVPSNCVNGPVTQYLLTLKMPPRNLLCAYAPSEAGSKG